MQRKARSELTGYLHSYPRIGQCVHIAEGRDVLTYELTIHVVQSFTCVGSPQTCR